MSDAPMYRIAVIGAGAIGRTHIDVLSSNPNAQLVAIADLDRETTLRAAQKAGSRGFISYREMMFEERLDGAIVCTPPSTHQTIVDDLIMHGIDVLCEKPFALNGKQARRMIDRAKTHDQLVMLASKFRYVEDVNQAQRSFVRGNSVRSAMRKSCLRRH